MVVDIGADLRAALREALRLNAGAAELAATFYSENWHLCPGAPAPDQLIEEDLPVVGLLNRYFDNRPTDFDDDLDSWTWEEFRRRTLDEIEREKQQADPYIPKWYMKTDEAGKQSPWVEDWANISEVARIRLNQICHTSRPNPKHTFEEQLWERPTTSDLALADTIESLLRMPKSLLRPRGFHGDGESAPYRWGASLCLASSMGLAAFRILAKKWGKDFEDWQHWATCPEPELVKDLIEAHRKSAYPLGFLRVPWHQLEEALGGERLAGPGGDNHVPLAYELRMLVHIFQHTRIVVTKDGKRALRVAYRGRYEVLDIESMHSSLGSAKHRPIASDLAAVLRLPYNTNRRNREWQEDCTARLFRRILPMYFQSAQRVSQRQDLIFAEFVEISETVEDPYEYRWMDPGLTLSNLAMIDLKTGVVDKDVVLRGADVASLAWQSDHVKPSTVMNWRANLPDVVNPALPTDVFAPYFKHQDWLGHEAGGKAMLNATILLGLFREDLAGTTVGRALSQEFPLIAIMPVDATKEDTTNQGKTNYGRTIMRIFEPAIREQKMELSSSAPAQRSMAMSFYRYGTALFDEFIQPTSPDHFLSPAGLQSLCTGGAVAPGKAGENAEPVALSCPMCIVQKVSSATPDILNRMLPLFLGKITPESQLTPEAMLKVMSPEIAMEARLSALLWGYQNNFVEMVRGISLKVGKWRFSAHMAVACLWASPEEINGYIDAATEQCEKQRMEAEETGLTLDLGIRETFNPKFFFDNVSEHTLGVLAMRTAEVTKTISPLEILRDIVEDDGKRNFARVLSDYRVKERSAQMTFVNQIKKPMIRGDWIMQWVPREKSERRDSASRPRGYMVVAKISESVLAESSLAPSSSPPPPPPPPSSGPPPPPPPSSGPPPPPPPKGPPPPPGL